MSDAWWHDNPDELPWFWRTLARIIGSDRLDRWEARAVAADAKREANRCTYVALDARCTKKSGHRGLCRTEYESGRVLYWRGATWPRNDRPI